MGTTEGEREDGGSGGDKSRWNARTSRPERPLVDVQFLDIGYSVRNRDGKKVILKGVSGNFASGELTAILGSSGAGKSTLMNILAGYVTAGVSGTIKANGKPRDAGIFNRLSAYIMQDDLIQLHLTVEESMRIAARLKLGSEFCKKRIHQIVNETLALLGLESCSGTRCEELSGGQRKRLSVALELVSDPTVVFLDEPTTGLDIVSAYRMVRLLRDLAEQGRTVICTIHQPSAAIFGMLHKMYVISGGVCVYQGTPDVLVTFLSSVGLACPVTHNPADYVLELVQGTEGDEAKATLTAEIRNGKLWVGSNGGEAERRRLPIGSRNPELSEICFRRSGGNYSATFSEQCSLLLGRKFKQQMRNKATLWIMLLHHLASGSFLGSIFSGVGEDANRPFDNFKFVVSVVVFFMYTHVMCPVLMFPSEVRLIRREYFNRWYSLKSYFVALTASTVPCQLILGFVVSAICYSLSGQPREIRRFLLFSVVGLMLGFASEGWGLAIGSLFSEMNGSIVGPATVVPLLAVGVYGMGFGTAVEPVMRFFMSASYLRHGIVGFSTALYGQNRSALSCDYERSDYCHYKDPELLLKDFGMEGVSFADQVLRLAIFVVFHRILAFLCLRYRLTAEFSTRILDYAAKALRRRK